MTRRQIGLNLGALLFAAATIAAWQALSDFKILSPIFFPAPTRTFENLVHRVADGSAWDSMRATCLRMLFGWFFASLFGVLLGAAIGLSASARAYLNPTLEFVRPLPASAVIPLAILFFGLTNQMSIAVVAFGALWPVLMSSIYGFSSVKPRLGEVAEALGLSRWDYLIKIAIPSAAPDIFSGIRVSLAISLIIAVVTEMQASLPGIGRDIFMAQRNFRSTDLYGGLVLIGIVGFVINFSLLALERRVLRWRVVHS